VELQHYSTCREYRIRADELPIVECMMGNGRRRVRADEVKVYTYPKDPWLVFVLTEGRTVLRDGREGRRAGVSWTIGGRWDTSADAPGWVLDLARDALASEV
jgi:hypothetical protein